MAERRFISWWVSGALTLLALVVLVNLVVDPYEIYGWVNIAGFNRNKTQAIVHSWMIKPYLIERTHPATLLLGSSRIEAGFDPESPVWPEYLRPVLNLGLPGAGPYEQYRILQDALATTRPKLVFFGVSFEDAQLAPVPAPSGAAAPVVGQGASEFEARLRVAADGRPNPGFWMARVKDLAATLLSLNALGDSIATVLTQDVSNHSRLTPLGFNTAADFRDLVRTEGENSLFLDKDREKVAEVVRWSADPRLDTASVARAIALARQHEAEVVVVIAPVYADEMEIYRQAGVMPLYDSWRREISDIVAAAAAHGNKVSLWDFSALTPYSTEPLPPLGDTRTQLHWFWESNHFKPALGDLVIARIFAGGPQDFGSMITPETLPAEQEAQHVLMRQYEATRPADVQRVADLFCREQVKFCDHSSPQASREDRDLIAVQQGGQQTTR